MTRASSVRRLVAAVGALAVGALTSLQACGDDDASNPSGTDGGGDSGRADGATNDANGGSDSSLPRDTGADTTSSSDAGPSDADASDAEAGPAVRGSRIVTRFLETTSAIEPTDMSQVPIEAVTELPDGGGFEIWPGNGLVDGSFVIPNVPEREYMLHYLETWIVLDAERDLDLAQRRYGRVTVTGGGRGIDFALTNLTPWSSGGRLAYTTINAFSQLTYRNSSPIITVGATTYNGFLNTSDQWRPDFAGFGDLTHVVQTNKENMDAGTYDRITSSLLSQQLTIPVDASAPVTGAMTAVAGTPFTQRVDHALAANYASSIPGAFSVGGTEYVVGTPTSWGTTSFPTIFMTLGEKNSTTSGTEDVAFAYGNPLGWTPWLMHYEFTFLERGTRPLPDGGVSLPASLIPAYVAIAPVASLTPTTPLGIELGPPLLLEVNGQDGYVDRTGVGLNPEISWSQSILGTPTYFRLEVRELEIDATGLRAAWSGPSKFLYTRSTSVRLPPGMLAAGKSYLIEVASVVDPGFSWTKPFSTSFAQRRVANTYTGAITP